MSDPWISAWAPPPPDAYLRRPVTRLPWPLEEPECRLYARARQGLRHGLAAAGVGKGDDVLVPAYHHGSEVGTMRREGIGSRYYEATDDLAPDPDELDRLVGPRTRALYLIHHLGFAQDAPRWRVWCDERGLLLVEDVAMSWLATHEGAPLGSWGDLAIFSPWKTYGLPEGGALMARRPPAEPPLVALPDVKYTVASHVKWVAQRFDRIGARHGRRRPPRVYDPVFEFETRNRDELLSRTSMFLLRRLARIDAAARRRENYGRLLDVFREYVPPPFASVPGGACPFAFPIRTDDKAGLLQALAERNVWGVDLWSVPHPSFPAERFPRAASLRESLVALPVHQELRPRQVDHMIEVLRDWHSRRPSTGRIFELATVREGDRAPEFELHDQDGNPVRLSSYAGRSVVLYFYPEADTPGCTAQACGIRDHSREIEKAGAVVLGVSPDKTGKLKAFADKYGLPFTLLADEKHEVAEQYGVWARWTRFGIPRWGNQRTTFLIGPDGTIQKVMPNVNPREHDDLVLRELLAA